MPSCSTPDHAPRPLMEDTSPFPALGEHAPSIGVRRERIALQIASVLLPLEKPHIALQKGIVDTSIQLADYFVEQLDKTSLSLPSREASTQEASTENVPTVSAPSSDEFSQEQADSSPDESMDIHFGQGRCWK